MKTLMDLTGHKYGRFTVIERQDKKRWFCRCQCGTLRVVLASSLRNGNTKSCGCLSRELTGIQKRAKTHGQSGKPEYWAWNHLISRCYNPNDQRYSIYGGRGIGVCKRWKESFVAFFTDMGPKPTRKHSIDRIDNDAGYTCGKCEECMAKRWNANCRWATLKEQATNRHNNIQVTIDERMMIVTDACKLLGTSAKQAQCRIRRGWSPIDAVSIPSLPLGTKRH